jgi:hypothetical protein
VQGPPCRGLGCPQVLLFFFFAACGSKKEEGKFQEFKKNFTFLEKKCRINIEGEQLREFLQIF